MSGHRHGNVSRSAPLDLYFPFPPPATPGYDCVSFAAVKRVLQEVESVSFSRCGSFVGVFVSLFYPVVFRFPKGQGMFFFSRATTLVFWPKGIEDFLPGDEAPGA